MARILWNKNWRILWNKNRFTCTCEKQIVRHFVRRPVVPLRVTATSWFLKIDRYQRALNVANGCSLFRSLKSTELWRERSDKLGEWDSNLRSWSQRWSSLTYARYTLCRRRVLCERNYARCSWLMECSLKLFLCANTLVNMTQTIEIWYSIQRRFKYDGQMIARVFEHRNLRDVQVIMWSW